MQHAFPLRVQYLQRLSEDQIQRWKSAEVQMEQDDNQYEQIDDARNELESLVHDYNGLRENDWATIEPRVQAMLRHLNVRLDDAKWTVDYDGTDVKVCPCRLSCAMLAYRSRNDAQCFDTGIHVK